MDTQEKLQAEIKKIEHKPIWKAVNSHGSMAIIEIGTPHLEIREDIRGKKTEQELKKARDWRVFAAGQYSLHIWDCEWEVRENKKYIGGTTSIEGVQKGLRFIEGRFIQSIEIKPRNHSLYLKFEHQISLRLRPFDHIDDQWFLYKNKGKRWSIFFDQDGELKKEWSKEVVAVM
jgi:hypothetical protein